MFTNRRQFVQTLGSLSLGLMLPFKGQSATALRIAIASDGHYGQPDTDCESFFNTVVERINAERNIAFSVFNGDLINDKGQFLPTVKAHFDRLKQPFYPTRGNHDMVTLDFWEQTFGIPTNYAFEQGDFGFILLDNSNEKGEYICPDANWMAQQIKSMSNKKGIFLFMHISPRKWTKYGIDCPEILDLIEKTPNVKAVFHGHDHDEDNQKIKVAGKPHFWDGHFGGNWGTAYRGYRILEIKKNGRFVTYQWNPEKGERVNMYRGR
jgi:3',5'-cyclic-AMP phosphodiesterase